MKQATTVLRIGTTRRGLNEITGEIAKWVTGQSCKTGLLTVFCRHTSASLLINENAAPEVRSGALSKAKLLSMTTGIFALLWAVVLVLMVVRPGHTRG